jgi:hypothetical protein
MATPAGRMATLQIDGYYDTLRHNNADKIIFFGMDIDNTLYIEGWPCNSVYVHDTRYVNGTIPQGTAENAFIRVRNALPSLRHHMETAAPQLMMWPDGRAGALHVVGGGWITGKVTFYIARGFVLGKWSKFLCANVY